MIHEAGYLTTERLVNAIEYGAPQDRQRVLFFGVRRELLEGQESLDDFPWGRHRVYTMEQINAFPWPQNRDFVEGGGDYPKPDGIPEELTVQY